MIPPNLFFSRFQSFASWKNQVIWINQKIYFEDYSLLQNTVFQTFQYGTKIRIKINTLLYWALLFVLCCSSNETFLSVGKMGWERVCEEWNGRMSGTFRNLLIRGRTLKLQNRIHKTEQILLHPKGLSTKYLLLPGFFHCQDISFILPGYDHHLPVYIQNPIKHRCRNKEHWIRWQLDTNIGSDTN